MCADLLARVSALEENGAIDAGSDEMVAVFRGGVVDVDAFAVQVDKDEVVGLGGDSAVREEHAPRMKSACNAWRQGPRARVVGLVDIENDAAAIEVEVGPGETRGFVDSWSFAMEKAVEDAELERNSGGCNELSVFVRVNPTLGFSGTDFGEESGWQWVCRDELQRKNRHFADAMEQLRNLSTRSHRTTLGNAAHDDARMIERKRINTNIANDRVYVVFEAADVVTDRFLHPHMIGIIASKVAPRPSLAQFANGGHFGIWPVTLANEVDIAKDVVERFGVRGAGRRIEISARDIEAPSFANFIGNFGKRGSAGVSLGFGLARRKGDGRAIGRVGQRDPSEPAAGGLENGAGTGAGHLVCFTR